MIGNKIADKITSISKISNVELPNNDEKEDMEITTHKKRYISPEERQRIIDELRLIMLNFNINLHIMLTFNINLHIIYKKWNIKK